MKTIKPTTKQDAIKKKSGQKNLRLIPGVGESIAQDLWELGFKSVQDLSGRDPEKMYQQLCTHTGTQVDRCVLYVFRSAVYYASHQKHDPELLKWWNWKDKK